jgi:hypothetical protein
MISILAILTNTIRYRYGIDASGIEAEPARHLYAEIWPDDELKVIIIKREITYRNRGMTPGTAS